MRIPLILALDGLDLESLKQIQTFVRVLDPLVSNRSAVKLEAEPLSDCRPMWAEMLTGVPWHDSGCYAYLDLDRQITRESTLKAPIRFSASNTNLVGFCNIPLVEPSNERLWMSDGVVPARSTVSAPHNGLINTYKPLPYTSLQFALPNIAAAVDACLNTEKTRLSNLLQMIQANSQADIECLFLRLSVFDHLAHLLGPDYLRDPEQVFAGQIQGFLHWFNAYLNDLLQLTDLERSCLLSLYSITRCVAAVNLNRLLFSRGYCTLIERNPNYWRERQKALLALGVVTEDSVQQEAVSWVVDADHSLAYSPAAGAVCLSVQQADHNTLHEILNFLQEQLAPIKDRNQSWWVRPKDQKHGPDIMVYFDGVEFVGTTKTVIDFDQHGRGVREPKGFAFFHNDAVGTEAIRPHQLTKPLLSWLTNT